MTFLEDLAACLREALTGDTPDHARINYRDTEEDAGAMELETRLAVLGHAQPAAYRTRYTGRVQLKIYADRTADVAAMLAAVERLWPTIQAADLLRLVWDPWEIPHEPVPLHHGVTRHTRTRAFTALVRA